MQFYNKLIQKSKLSLMQIKSTKHIYVGTQQNSWDSYSLHMLLKQGSPFHSISHLLMKSFII